MDLNETYLRDELLGVPLVEIDKNIPSDGDQPQKKQETDSKQKNVSHFEEILEDIGSEGKFQKLLILGILFPVAYCSALGLSNTTLLFTTPEHSCHVPDSPFNDSAALSTWKNMTIPWEKDAYGGLKLSSCHMYNISRDQLSEYILEDGIQYKTSEEALKNDSIIECQHGWDFDTSSWKETPVSHFEWVCEEKHTVTTLFSLTFAGHALGTFVFSITSDRYGRKPTFYFVLALSLLSSIPSIVAPNLALYAVLKFFLALSYNSFYQVPYILAVEVCGERFRNLLVVTSLIATVLGNCSVSLFAYLFPDWKIFIVVCHLPSAVFIFCYRFIPESPRWLLSQSKIPECETVLRRIARTNGKVFSESSKRLLVEAQKEVRKGNAMNIFASAVLVKHLILSSLLLSIGFSTYSGMMLNVHNMPGNKMVNFFILALVGIPGNILGGESSRHLGRRFSIIIFNALSALCCILATLAVETEWGLAILCSATKMFTGSSILVVFMQIGELFPTYLRGTAYGIASVMACSSVIFIPPLIALGGSNVYLPYYILFSLGIFALISSSFLPETIGRPLPQTLPEATSIGRNQPYFSFIHKWNAHKYLEADELKSKDHRRKDEEIML